MKTIHTLFLAVALLSLSSGDTPLVDCSPSTHLRKTPAASEAGTPTWTEEDQYKMQKAAVRNDTLTIKTLLDKGVPVDIGHEKGHAPLLLAAREGSVEAAALLIEYGANINGRDAWENTALTVSLGHPELARLLVERGADANAASPSGRTPLMSAAMLGSKESVVLLLEHGADIDARDEVGRSALLWALRSGAERVSLLLVTRGANIQFEDETGFNALRYAASHDMFHLVKKLIEKGMDVNQVNKRGYPIIYHAGSPEMRELLHELGAK